MAIKKSDVVGKFTDNQKKEIKVLEELIDRHLQEEYVGGPVRVTISPWPDQKVRQEITRLYAEAGWKVHFGPDPRNGQIITLE